MMCFHCTISKFYSVIRAITSLLSKLKVAMYIPTTLYEFSFILHVESMAKTVIKGTISQISLGNSSSQTMANPFHSLQIYWHLPFCVNTYFIACSAAYTTYWGDGELKLQLMIGQLRVGWFNIKPALNQHWMCVWWVDFDNNEDIATFSDPTGLKLIL